MNRSKEFRSTFGNLETQSDGCHIVDDQLLVPGQRIADHYLVKKLLGKGGMGQVYLVEHDAPMHSILYAVKILKPKYTHNAQQLQQFLEELRMWSRLPDHPNITTCRFFKTLYGKVMIFSEYVKGGSCLDWIQKGKIDSLEKAVDIFIQTARGLKVAHDLGIIHQDVKPANILITDDGTAKITDFGLATSRKGEWSGVIKTDDLITVSVHGLTPAFCSPEQFSQERIGPGADIWSLALTMLHMLQGNVTWSLGVLAGEVFSEAVANNFKNFKLQVPGELIEILHKCFKEKPNQRWLSMDQLICSLEEFYHHQFKQKYPRSKVILMLDREKSPLKSRSKPLIKEIDPEKWLALIRQRSPGFNLPDRGVEYTVREQALTDLKMLETVVNWFEQNHREDPDSLWIPFIDALRIKADLQNFLNDYDGAVSTDNRAHLLAMEGFKNYGKDIFFEELLKTGIRLMISLKNRHKFEEAVESGQITENYIVDSLATIEFNEKNIALVSQFYINLGSSMNHLVRYNEAFELFSRAETIIRDHSEILDENMFSTLLQILYSNKANSSKAMGNIHEAIAYNESVMVEYEKQFSTNPQPQTLISILITSINLGETLGSLGRFQEEYDLYSKSINHLKNSTNIIEGIDLRHLEINLIINRSLCAMNRKQYQKAIDLIEPGRILCLKAIQNDGRTDLLLKLALIYMNIAIFHAYNGNQNSAREDLEKSVSLFEYLVFGSRPELVRYLGLANMNLAEILTTLKEYSLAVERFDAALDLTQKEKNDQINFFQGGDRGNILVHKAEVLMHLGQYRKATDIATSGLELLKKEYEKTGLVIYRDQIDWARKNLKQILKGKLNL